MLNDRRVGFLCVLMNLCALALANPVAWGQCELEKLLASDGETNDRFGFSVAIGPTMAVVGARYEDGQSGAVYVFDGQQLWVETHKLTQNGGEFGFSVAISGDILVVGARLDHIAGDTAGAVYVYGLEGSDWRFEQILAANDAAEGHGTFGTAVDIDGDVIIIGSSNDDDFGQASGSAYIFRYDGFQWEQEQKLLASDGDIDDRFGESVAIYGDIALVGAIHNDDACPKDPSCNSGSTYVYEFKGSQWIEVQKLVPDDTNQGARFGWSVSLDGYTALIGAPQDHNENGTFAGAAYIFVKGPSIWEQQQKLIASDGEQGDTFGRSVAISGERIIIGVPFDDDMGNNAGAAFVFGETSPLHSGKTFWTEQAKLLASDGQGGAGFGESFGFAVAIDGDLAVVGAKFDTDNGLDSGSAYIFLVDLDSPDCNENGIPDNCEPDCNENGIADECDVADGFSKDCDGDEVPDDCQVLYFVEASPQLGPIGDGVPQTYVFITPPEVSPQPATQVLITMTASADLGSAAEWIDVFLNDQLIGTVFEQDGNDCSDPSDEAQLVLDGETYSLLVAGGDAEFQFVASFAVDAELCQDSFVTVQIEYQAVTEDDCNGNGIPDICDILFGGFDDKNGNWIPDECEEVCPWDLDKSGSVGTSDLLELFAQWGTDGPADFDESGVVGTSDLLILFANWGTCP